MKYSILGFNQNKIVNYKKVVTVTRQEKELEKVLQCDLQDLLILNYIIYANSNPKMKHICKDEKSYVWLQHKHIIEDLPILNITQATLGNRLGKLKSMELIESTTIANNKNQGSMTYYTITEICQEMMFDTEKENQTTTFKNDVVDRPPNFKMMSNNISNLDNNTFLNNKLFKNNNITKTGTDLYTFCINCIDDFCSKYSENGLRDNLIKYLNLRLEMKDKQLYKNMWKGLLTKLEKCYNESSGNVDFKDIINQSIEKGYATFYPITNNYKKQKADNIYWKDDYNLDEDSYKRSEEKF